MQQSLIAFAVPKAQAELSRVERLVAEDKRDRQRERMAAQVGLAWPPQRSRTGPGRPTRQSLWEQALYRAIRDLTLSANVQRKVPRWWRGGSIASEEMALERVVEEAQPAFEPPALELDGEEVEEVVTDQAAPTKTQTGDLGAGGHPLFLRVPRQSLPHQGLESSAFVSISVVICS